MNNDEFRRDFGAMLARAGEKADLVVKKTALELQSSMISMSPVDTGRFKGNWQAGIGGVNPAIDSPPNSDAVGRTAVTLDGWKAGQTIYLTNSLPYAKRLEHGWSKQAPAGMVRLTVQNYARALAKAVQEVK